MSSVAPLDYAMPAQRRRKLIPPGLAALLLSVVLGLLAADVFALALPTFPALRREEGVRVGEWAYMLFGYATMALSILTAVTTVACWYSAPANWMLRLARSISLGMLIFHIFFAPGAGAYERLLWGPC
jgi:hypothetical protein